GHQRLGVGGDQIRVDGDVARAAGTAYGDARDLQRGADAGREMVRLLGQDPHHFGADHSATEQAYLERLVVIHSAAPMSSASRSSSVSRRTTTRRWPSLTAITGGRGTWL